MSWTKEKKDAWTSKRDTLIDRFTTAVDAYRRAVVTDKVGSPQLIELERQMGSAREELARLGWDINESLEDLRNKTGNLSEPVLQLDKKLNRLAIEETILQCNQCPMIKRGGNVVQQKITTCCSTVQTVFDDEFFF